MDACKDNFICELAASRPAADNSRPTVISDESGAEYMLLTRAHYLKLVDQGPSMLEIVLAHPNPELEAITDEEWDAIYPPRHEPAGVPGH